MFICTVIWWIYLKFTCIDITHIHTRLTVPTLKVQPARHPRSRRQRQEAASILLPCSQSQDEQKTKMFTNQIYNIIPIIHSVISATYYKENSTRMYTTHIITSLQKVYELGSISVISDIPLASSHMNGCCDASKIHSQGWCRSDGARIQQPRRFLDERFSGGTFLSFCS